MGSVLCCFTRKGSNKSRSRSAAASSEFQKAVGSSKIAASQADVAPLLFDLVKIRDYHPYLGKAEIVGDQTEGVGAKRKLTYTMGKSFFETVTETNGVDSIAFELSEHFFPCKQMIARMSIERIDDTNTTFKTTFEYKMADGVSHGAASKFDKLIQKLAVDIAHKAKGLFKKNTRDLREP